MRIARIGVFELDVEAGELRRSGRLVALTGQPMRVLVKLVERAGEVVTREELQREIWGEDTHVDFEAGLSTCINQVRTALGDRATSPRFLETLPRRGFRFIAPVEWPVGNGVPPRASSAARIDRRLAIVAILFVMAAGFAWRVNRSQ
ncbi:MAG TPA: winged helix-turn-helix domain-containing protein, partial [Vicinamibacteria bacterium]|nr:winged helix-turn-helix domain-containing protein [Vicinamibacteria bacterium]